MKVAIYFSHRDFTFISGAGILANGTRRIDLSNCTFRSNSARSGGAVAVLGGTVSISRCRFRHNIAAKEAGALFIKSDRLELKSSYLENNAALEKGGAILLDASIRSKTSEIRCHDNIAGDGGCLWSSSSRELVIEESSTKPKCLPTVRIQCVGHGAVSEDPGRRQYLFRFSSLGFVDDLMTRERLTTEQAYCIEAALDGNEEVHKFFHHLMGSGSRLQQITHALQNKEIYFSTPRKCSTTLCLLIV